MDAARGMPVVERVASDQMNVSFFIVRVILDIAVVALFFALGVTPGRRVSFLELFAEAIGIAGRKLHSSEQREANDARVADVAPNVEETGQRQVADPRFVSADDAVVLDAA